MELDVFQFTNDALLILKNHKKDLNHCVDILDDFFSSSLDNSCEGFFNISTRIKSPLSLKEKIIRHNYYLKYKNVEELFNNLSDLIGIRIECRFIEDEKHIFKFIKSLFSKVNDEGISYSNSNNNIFLDLRDEQPLKQKNGFKLYRIDGYVLYKNNKFNFELQIKSMVNTFWGEIEHKVIYKNYNMLLTDNFYKNILNSIKSNLSLIDNQLLSIYNHIDSSSSNIDNTGFKKEALQLLLSKTIFDIYSSKVKNDLGVSVDFRNACDIIIDYIFSKYNCNTPEEYYTTFLNTSIRINEVFKNPISFKSKIYVGECFDFKSDFSIIMSKKLLYDMNNDFHWNLFFKILFEIEPGNNLEDFTIFIKYLEILFSHRDNYLNLYLKYASEDVEIINKDILEVICASFLDVNSIKFIYRDKLSEIFVVLHDYIDFLCDTVGNFANYTENKTLYCEFLHLNIISIFNVKVSVALINEFYKELKNNRSNLRITSKGIKYITSLDEDSEILASNILEYLYMR